MIRALRQRFCTAATIFPERIHRAAGRIALAGAKSGPQRHRTDKGKQRQVTIAAIETVKEPSFLMTVQRVIGGIQVDDDLQAMLGQAAHTHQQKVVFDRLMVGADFMTTSILLLPSSSRFRVEALASALP